MPKFILNDNGTVPVKFVKFYSGYGAGEVAGFAPTVSETLVNGKYAIYVGADGMPIPDDVVEAVAGDAPPPAPFEPLPPGAEIPIPDDWADTHHLRRIALAAKISGSPVTTDADAVEIIQAEINRRNGTA